MSDHTSTTRCKQHPYHFKLMCDENICKGLKFPSDCYIIGDVFLTGFQTLISYIFRIRRTNIQVVPGKPGAEVAKGTNPRNTPTTPTGWVALCGLEVYG